MSGPTCQQSIELMLEYLDGTLDERVRSRLEAHFGDCSPCEEFLASYRATPKLCRKALETDLPESVAHKLTEFLRLELKKP